MSTFKCPKNEPYFILFQVFREIFLLICLHNFSHSEHFNCIIIINLLPTNKANGDIRVELILCLQIHGIVLVRIKEIRPVLYRFLKTRTDGNTTRLE